MTEKFRIILAGPGYMRTEYPVAKQQRIVAATKTPTFFMETRESEASLDDVLGEINEWNRENIAEIVVEGPMTEELTAMIAFASLGVAGIPVVRGESDGYTDPNEFGYYM